MAISFRDIQDKWEKIKTRCRCRKDGAMVRALLNGCTLIGFSEGILLIQANANFHYTCLCEPKCIEVVDWAISCEIKQEIIHAQFIMAIGEIDLRSAPRLQKAIETALNLPGDGREQAITLKRNGVVVIKRRRGFQIDTYQSDIEFSGPDEKFTEALPSWDEWERNSPTNTIIVQETAKIFRATHVVTYPPRYISAHMSLLDWDDSEVQEVLHEVAEIEPLVFGGWCPRYLWEEEQAQLFAMEESSED